MGAVHDEELRRRWSRSEVGAALVTGGLWLHEAAEAALPSPLSVLVPASDGEAMANAAALVQRVVEQRDAGGDSAAAVLDVAPPQRAGFDLAERASWKAMQAARWSVGGAKMTAEARAQQKVQMKQMRTGPARNVRAELRLSDPTTQPQSRVSFLSHR